MNCPTCGAKSKVLNSHSPPKRRRECLACKARWTTVEVGRDEWERLKRVARYMNELQKQHMDTMVFGAGIVKVSNDGIRHIPIEE